VPNEKRLLKVGGFAKVDILTRKDDKALSVRAEAVVTYIGSSRVFVVRSGKAHQVPVKLGETGRDTYKNPAGKLVEYRWVEVVGDLDPQSQVISSGQRLLAEGTPVRIRESESTQPRRPQPESKP